MVIPTFITLADWAASLIVDYPNDGIPGLWDETKWQDWAATVLACPSFATCNAPTPYQYENWQDWAYGLFNSATIPS